MKTPRDVAIDVLCDFSKGDLDRGTLVLILEKGQGDTPDTFRRLVKSIEKHIEADRRRAIAERAPS